jgi:hypothetical protein
LRHTSVFKTIVFVGSKHLEVFYTSVFLEAKVFSEYCKIKVPNRASTQICYNTGQVDQNIHPNFRPV